MKRSRQYLTVMAVGVGVWVYGETVYAGMVPLPPPGPARIANADAVIVGKVEALEPGDVKVGRTTYHIAVVRINEGIKGTKNEKTLRVGFILVEKPGPGIRRTGYRPEQLEVGMAGLFILSKQDKENIYTIRGVPGYYISSDMNKDFEKEVKTVKAIAKMMTGNPQAALKAKDAEERLLAAAILVEKYRSYSGPASKQTPIDAEESKQILQIIADADWTVQGNFRSLRPNPGQLFRQLGITKTDGFTVPPGGDYQAAVKAWVRANAEKYRIQRYLGGKSR